MPSKTTNKTKERSANTKTKAKAKVKPRAKPTKKGEDGIEFNPQFEYAFRAISETDKNVFITGRAGTGKSTLLNYTWGDVAKNMVVLAPTGVAAVNIGGQTIHSFFGFKPDITLDKVKRLKSEEAREFYQQIDAIVIDEVSMVRADLMDCVDKFLRLNTGVKDKPFGGIQMIFFGDLYQLPPVLTSKEKKSFEACYESPYFFDSGVVKKYIGSELELIELEKIYRQSDDEFINILNSIRNRSAGEEELEKLNERVDEDFAPDDDDLYVYITPTNKKAEQINKEKLDALNADLYIKRGKISGNFEKKYLPTAEELELKPGSQIMLLNNDNKGRWVNGTMARIIDIEEDTIDEYGDIKVELEDSGRARVTPFTWSLYNYVLDEETRQIKTKTVGSFTQYPIKLAWAMTIHKSQGKTFEKVILDIDKGTFTSGQLYVALSRSTCLEGLVLKKPIARKHIWMDWRVVRFITSHQYAASEKEFSFYEKVELIEKAIKEKKYIRMTYLKANDTKSKRDIKPKKVGEAEYMGKEFTGVLAHCCRRGEERMFRVDRILQMEIL